MADDLGDDAAVPLDQIVGRDGIVRGRRSDDEVITIVADTAHLVDPADVDEHRGIGQTQTQQRNQAVPAGEDLGVLAVLAERLDRLVDRRDTDVVECGGNHC